jgi:hypothetical protein
MIGFMLRLVLLEHFYSLVYRIDESCLLCHM